MYSGGRRTDAKAAVRPPPLTTPEDGRGGAPAAFGGGNGIAVGSVATLATRSAILGFRLSHSALAFACVRWGVEIGELIKVNQYLCTSFLI